MNNIELYFSLFVLQFLNFHLQNKILCIKKRNDKRRVVDELKSVKSHTILTPVKNDVSTINEITTLFFIF